MLVHGITDPQWNFESRWTSWAPWVNKIAHTSEHGFKCYKYDIESDDSPIFAPNGIENEALQLLDAVARWREQCIDADVCTRR